LVDRIPSIDGRDRDFHRLVHREVVVLVVDGAVGESREVLPGQSRVRKAIDRELDGLHSEHVHQPGRSPGGHGVDTIGQRRLFTRSQQQPRSRAELLALLIQDTDGVCAGNAIPVREGALEFEAMSIPRAVERPLRGVRVGDQPSARRDLVIPAGDEDLVQALVLDPTDLEALGHVLQVDSLAEDQSAFDALTPYLRTHHQRAEGSPRRSNRRTAEQERLVHPLPTLRGAPLQAHFTGRHVSGGGQLLEGEFRSAQRERQAPSGYGPHAPEDRRKPRCAHWGSSGALRQKLAR
jgi:hypothetical protein